MSNTWAIFIPLANSGKHRTVNRNITTWEWDDKAHAVAGEQNKQTTEEKTFTCKVRFSATWWIRLV